MTGGEFLPRDWYFMPTTIRRSAVPTVIGFYHQGLFALISLLDGDDNSSVSVESDDDVVLHGAVTTLHQLKHSLGSPQPVTIKSNGFWNTLSIWADAPVDGSCNFVFVTCAKLPTGCDLEVLQTRGSDREPLIAALNAEATRVKTARDAARAADTPVPYAERGDHCEKFLKLGVRHKKKLVDLISISPNSFNANDVPAMIATRLRNSIPPLKRDALIERLIEWWDRQAALSLLKKRSRQLSKLELQSHLQDLIVEHSATGLPNDFGDQVPPPGAAEVGNVMREQILWVNGGVSRIQRAALAHWRSRNQRERWLNDDLAVASDLENFDERIIGVWSGRHSPMKEDCEGLTIDQQCKHGLTLLDWSHHDISKEVEAIKPKAPHIFLVQGSIQQLAEEGRVGWHPNYVALLEAYKARNGD